MKERRDSKKNIAVITHNVAMKNMRLNQHINTMLDTIKVEEYLNEKFYTSGNEYFTW